MSLESATLRPWALTDLESARDYVKLTDSSRDEMLIQLVNRATGVLERRTQRRLRTRPYTASAAVTGCETDETATLTTTGSFAAVRMGMQVTCAGVPTGTFVRSVESTTSLTLSQPATASASGLAATFTGLGPLMLHGTGEAVIVAPEGPVTEIISAGSISDSVLTSIDYSSIGLGGRLLRLTDSVWPWGSYNIQLAVQAGYVPGIHDSDLDVLEHCCLRLVQVMYQDFEDRIGRGSDITVQGAAIQFIDSAMPKDIAGSIDTFKRIAA
jgi:hypothetical protein